MKNKAYLHISFIIIFYNKIKAYKEVIIMCHGFGFYSYPNGIWFMGGMFIFRALFALAVLILGYKLLKGFLNNKAHTD